MTDRRIDVVAEMLDIHRWEEGAHGCDAWPECDWRADRDNSRGLLAQHDEHLARSVIAALDAAARRRPFIGIVPPVRLWADRDRSGEVEEPEVTLEQAVDWKVARSAAAVAMLERLAARSPDPRRDAALAALRSALAGDPDLDTTTNPEARP